MKRIFTPERRKKTILFLSMSAGGLATFFTILTGFFDSVGLFSSDPPDMSGTWLIKNEIQYSDKRSYIGTQAGFKLFIQQEGHTIYGDGEKISVNNHSLLYEKRVRIEVSGRIYGDSVKLNFKEFGLMRVTVGSFNWFLSNDSLSGRFNSTAASSMGKSFGVRFEQ